MQAIGPRRLAVTTPREQAALVTAWVASALVLAIIVWLVYFAIEAARLLNIWPA